MSGFPQKFYHAVFWPIRILMGFAHPIVHVRGLENIPDGPAVICCNHSSFSDAIWVIVCSHQKRIFRTMAKKELFSHRVLGWFITKLGAFPVDREANDIHAVKTALGVLREGDKLLIFPEGTRGARGGCFPSACRRRDVRLPDGRADRSGVPDAQEALLGAPDTRVRRSLSSAV